MTLGERIVVLRTQRGLNRAELHRLIVQSANRPEDSISYTVLQRIEKNVTSAMRDKSVAAIARALRVTPAELRGETEITTPVVSPETRSLAHEALDRFIAQSGGSGARVEALLKQLEAAVRRTRKDDQR